MPESFPYNNTVSSNTETNFDYIIAGAGCAGLSLVLRIIKQPLLQKKRILIIDSSTKTENDRTWCFWEKGEGFFEDIVHHQWPQLLFHYGKHSLPLNIAPYKYKMIRGIDFYNHAINIISKQKNITWLNANVEKVGNENGNVFVIANGKKYTAQYVFNSILFKEEKGAFEKDNCYKLLQHFKGWMIETQQPVFNPLQATFMDFRVSQQPSAAFVYVLPVSPVKALIEYTFFNEKLLQHNEYDVLLKNYLQTFWNLHNYKISETEYGVIPMTDHKFKTHHGNLINIGTAGGWTKPSSGFTFQFIQKKTKAISDALANNCTPVVTTSLFQKRFHIYDATLLNVLHNNKMQGSEVFHQLFAKQKPQTIFRFLDNESNFIDELKIMNSMPITIFLPAAITELIK